MRTFWFRANANCQCWASEAVPALGRVRALGQTLALGRTPALGQALALGRAPALGRAARADVGVPRPGEHM